MRFQKHIPLLVALIVFEVFSVAVPFKMYIKKIESTALENKGSKITIFKNASQYTSIIKGEPERFHLLVIENKEDTTNKIFYINFNNIKIYTYSNDKLIDVEEKIVPYTTYILIPYLVISFFILAIFTIHKINRTGEFMSNRLYTMENDVFERLLLMYGLSMLTSTLAILFVYNELL